MILQLIFRYYYSSKSASEHGTLYQLRNAINRTNVVKVPLDNFHACDDFFVLTIECHVLSAAMKILNMDSLESLPADGSMSDPENVWMMSDEERRRLLNSVATRIVDNYTHTNYHGHKS